MDDFNCKFYVNGKNKLIISSTLLAANTISNTCKIAKTIHSGFFGENGGSNHHSDSQYWWLQILASDIEW